MLDAVSDGRVMLATSSLVEAEVGHFAALRDNGHPFLDQVRLVEHHPSHSLRDDRLVARDATRLHKAWRPYAASGKKMNAADAVHLAAAVRLGCDHLMTHDEGFPLGQTVDGVKVGRTEMVWHPTLFTDN